MARSFGVSAAFVDAEVSRFIAAGRLSAKIDKTGADGGVIVTSRPDNRNAAYQAIVKEGDVGEEMYMVVRGTIKLASDSYELYNDRNWVDGAFFGELTVLGIGAGAEHNRHVYSASASVQSDCIFITQNSLDTLQLLYPTFKFKMRDM